MNWTPSNPSEPTSGHAGDPTMESSGARMCPKCGKTFICDIAAGKSTCWCFKLPQNMKVPQTSDTPCLCPTCLSNLARM
ncbi:MAG: cysteine-rich CWC family protein [bacterium]